LPLFLLLFALGKIEEIILYSFILLFTCSGYNVVARTAPPTTGMWKATGWPTSSPVSCLLRLTPSLARGRSTWD